MPEPADRVSTPIHLHRWNDSAVIGVSLVALFAGFGQFGVVAALGDVGKAFGGTVHGSLVSQVGLSGSRLGIGLAIIRAASLGSLPLSGMADRFGRRTMVLTTVGIGLAFTVAAAISPGYWWFVAIFALGRPFLSATVALTQVSAVEETAAAQRAKAVALVAAGYAVGAGLIAIIHSLGSSAIGFRAIFALAVIPLILVPLVGRWVAEPDRFAVVAVAREHPLPVLGAIRRPYLGRLAVLSGVAFAISVITGPANSFIFLYAQNIVHLSGLATAAMVVGSGVAGLGGLLFGRWATDRVGRRPTAAAGMLGVAVFGTVAYTGGGAALIVGYVFGVVSASLLAPALGAMIGELYPTEVRASVAGWWLVAGVAGAAAGLVIFGALSGSDSQFGHAALLTFLPAAAMSGLLWLVPETRGREPEDLWPGS
jgi:MFS family permease